MPKTKVLKREYIINCVKKMGLSNTALGKNFEKQFNKIPVQYLIVLHNHLKR